MRCKRIKKNGERCKAGALKNHPTQYCRAHAKPVGIEAGGTKHMKYSTVLPPKIAERYLEAVEDRELSSVKHELALVDRRIEELVDRMGGNASKKAWEAALFKCRALSKKKEEQGQIEQEDIDSVVEMLAAGLDESITWDEAYRAISLRNRLADTEVKRMRVLDNMVPITQVIALLTAVANIVRNNVSNGVEIETVRKEIAQLTARPELVVVE